MHILHFPHSLFEPVLSGHIRVLFLGCKGFRCHQTPVVIVYGNAPQTVPVCFIQKIHPPLDIHILVGQIVLFYHIVINRIRNLPHTTQIILQVFPCLFHQLLCTLGYFLPG